MLILLDNALDPAAGAAAAAGQSTARVVVITSRNDLTSLVAMESRPPAGRRPDDLTPRRTSYWLAGWGAERLAGAGDAAAELIALCARLPLALAIGAARAALQPERPLAGVAAELRDSASRLDSLAAGDALSDVTVGVLLVVPRAVRPAAGAFRLLGVASRPRCQRGGGGQPARRSRPPRLGESFASWPARTSWPSRCRAGTQCTTCSVSTPPSSRTRIARPSGRPRSPGCSITTWARRATQPGSSIRRGRGQRRSRLRPGCGRRSSPSSGAALAWFQAERQVLIAVETLAASSGLDRHAVKLPWAMTTYLGRTGQWHGWAVLQRIALAAAERSGDRAGQARIQVSLGRADERLGRLEDSQSHLIHAVELYRALDDHAGQGDVHITMARILEVMGRQQASLGQAEEAVVQFRLAGNIIGQGDALNTVGWQHILLGQYEEALTVCREAFDLCRQAQNRFGEAATWDSIGYAHYHLGQATEAITCYEQGLSIVCDLGDRSGQAAIRDHMGDAYLLTGDPQRSPPGVGAGAGDPAGP